MRVGAEIGEHSFGSRERGLRVNDPVATARLLAEHWNGRVVAEFSAFEGAHEAVEEFPSEDLGQSANRKQKIRRHGSRRRSQRQHAIFGFDLGGADTAEANVLFIMNSSS